MSEQVVLRSDTGAAVPLIAGLTATLDRVVCGGCVTLLMAILVTMVLQITFRYVLATPLTWTEELARYLFIWACWLGAPVAMRRGSHVVIAVVLDRLPSRIARAVSLITQTVALVFLVQLAVQGTILALRSHTVEAITLPIPWSAIYAAAPISAVLMILNIVEAAWMTIARPAQEVAS